MSISGRYYAMPFAGEHAVVFVADDRPEWWQVVARFHNQKRAEDYADVENIGLQDNYCQPDVKAPPPADPAPEHRPIAPIVAKARQAETSCPKKSDNCPEDSDGSEEPEPATVADLAAAIERASAAAPQPRNSNAPPRNPKSGTAPKRRFTDLPPMQPERVTPLAADHPAVVEGRTLFPSTVKDPRTVDRVLVSGSSNRKLGDRIAKGPWAGMPIYHLSLEERATCPRECAQWATCYGNAMQMGRRHKHGGSLLIALAAELGALSAKHPQGFAVRLHTLGDFYDLGYVQFWADALDQWPRLHVFGYSARPLDSEIGMRIKKLTRDRWDRFAIRFSREYATAGGTMVIDHKPDGTEQGIVCPAETGKTDCCGTCGLCWSPSARDKCIVFVLHGNPGRGEAAPKAEPQPEPKPKPEPALAGEAGLTPREEKIWRAIAEAISETGRSPLNMTISARAEISASFVSQLLRALEDKGYIARRGKGRLTTIHVLKWPEGVPPRETNGREDGAGQESQASGAKPDIGQTVEWPALRGRGFDTVDRAPKPEPGPKPEPKPEEDSGPVMDAGGFADPVPERVAQPKPNGAPLPNAADQEDWLRKHGGPSRDLGRGLGDSKLGRAVQFLRDYTTHSISKKGGKWYRGTKVVTAKDIIALAKEAGWKPNAREVAAQ